MKFKGTNPMISLDTGIDISNGTFPEIHYEKPDGTTGEWSAVIEEDTKVRYQTTGDDIDQTGIWRFQAVVTINNFLKKGEIVEVTIDNPIKED